MNIFNFAKPIRPILVFYFRVEIKFARDNFRGILFAVYFAGGKFRAKSKFANIAKISSMRNDVLYSIRTLAYAYILIDYKLVHIIQKKYLLCLRRCRESPELSSTIIITS